MGCTGYCMGGRHALPAAGTFPERFKAMASLHGSFQVAERPDSQPMGERRAAWQTKRSIVIGYRRPRLGRGDPSRPRLACR